MKVVLIVCIILIIGKIIYNMNTEKVEFYYYEGGKRKLYSKRKIKGKGYYFDNNKSGNLKIRTYKRSK